MPYSNSLRAWYGNEAITVAQSCQNALVTFLQAQLNTGAYASILGANVTVTTDVVIARNAFKQGVPSVLVVEGPHGKPSQSATSIAGVYYPGLRHDITLDVDLAFAVKLATTDGSSLVSIQDDKLANCVKTSVERSYSALMDLGLFNCEISGDGEKQRNPQMRNPHVVTFFTVTLDNYAP